MQKRVLGYLLTILGFGGMALAGYLFVTGSGDRLNLLEVTCYMIVGATCFFTGINYIYEALHSFSEEEVQRAPAPELEEVTPIQQQWRTIHIAQRPSRENSSSKASATA